MSGGQSGTTVPPAPPPPPSRPAPTDEELVGQFLAGDDQAFAALVRRHERAVAGLVRRYAPDPDDARDLVQRAFVRAFTAAARPRFLPGQGARKQFQGWLFRIAINLGRNHARDRRRWQRAPAEEAEQVAVAAPGSAALERAQQSAALREAVKELPRRQREVFALRIDAGLPFKEVAAALGISENNAKVNFHHATSRLRTLLVVANPGGEP